MKLFKILCALLVVSLFACKSDAEKLEIENDLKREKSHLKFSQANSSVRAGKYIIAEQLYDEAITIDPDFALAYLGRAEFKKDQLKQYAGSISDYNTSIFLIQSGKDFKGQLLDCYAGRGDAKYKLGDYYGAMLDYDEAIKVNAHVSVIYMERALIQYKYGKDIEGACRDWSKAGELGDRRAYEYIEMYCN